MITVSEECQNTQYGKLPGFLCLSSQKEPQWKDVTDVYRYQKNVVKYLKFADFATDAKTNCRCQLF